MQILYFSSEILLLNNKSTNLKLCFLLRAFSHDKIPQYFFYINCIICFTLHHFFSIMFILKIYNRDLQWIRNEYFIYIAAFTIHWDESMVLNYCRSVICNVPARNSGIIISLLIVYSHVIIMIYLSSWVQRVIARIDLPRRLITEQTCNVHQR